ncbi:MAG: M43 family zinc metalloprotease [Bacteroidota bacterium]|nr:M43 family zinc metalloprotease [Bacteroidota bacterium]
MIIRTIILLSIFFSTLVDAQSPWCPVGDKSNSVIDSLHYQQLYSKVQNAMHGTLDTRAEKYLPVVVHIITFRGFPVISQAQIIRQIDVLNADFAGEGENVLKVSDEFKSLIADTGIRFCLAKTDPEGNPTNGITYDITSIANIGFRTNDFGRVLVYYTQEGGTSAWDPSRYINIWVCEIQPSILGSASFPGMASFPEETGILIDFRYFGSLGPASYNTELRGGHTLTHEMGHYLGLFHIWGITNAGCSDDDGIMDTPVADRPWFGCPSGVLTSCGVSNMYQNFMDQTDDRCLAAFTPGQAQFMQASIDLFYPDLAFEGECQPVVQPFQSWYDQLQWVYDVLSGQYVIYTPSGFSPEITIDIFSMDGKLITSSQESGYRSYLLQLDNVVQGVYIARITSGDTQFVRKISVY